LVLVEQVAQTPLLLLVVVLIQFSALLLAMVEVEAVTSLVLLRMVALVVAVGQ